MAPESSRNLELRTVWLGKIFGSIPASDSSRVPLVTWTPQRRWFKPRVDARKRRSRVSHLHTPPPPLDGRDRIQHVSASRISARRASRLSRGVVPARARSTTRRRLVNRTRRNRNGCLHHVGVRALRARDHPPRAQGVRRAQGRRRARAPRLPRARARAGGGRPPRGRRLRAPQAAHGGVPREGVPPERGERAAGEHQAQGRARAH